MAQLLNKPSTCTYVYDRLRYPGTSFSYSRFSKDTSVLQHMDSSWAYFYVLFLPELRVAKGRVHLRIPKYKIIAVLLQPIEQVGNIKLGAQGYCVLILFSWNSKMTIHKSFCCLSSVIFLLQSLVLLHSTKQLVLCFKESLLLCNRC